MRNCHIIVLLSMSIFMTVPSYTADDAANVMKQYPATMWNLIGEIRRTSAEDVQRRVTDACAQLPHHDSGVGYSGLQSKPVLLTIRYVIDQTMRDEVALKLLSLIEHKLTDWTKRDPTAYAGRLDPYTRFTLTKNAATGVCNVVYVTNLTDKSVLNAAIELAQKGN